MVTLDKKTERMLTEYLYEIYRKNRETEKDIEAAGINFFRKVNEIFFGAVDMCKVIKMYEKELDQGEEKIQPIENSTRELYRKTILTAMKIERELSKKGGQT